MKLKKVLKQNRPPKIPTLNIVGIFLFSSTVKDNQDTFLITAKLTIVMIINLFL